MVWTETLVTSNGTVNVQLPKPYAKENYYRDAFVITYPSLPVEKSLMKDKLVRVLANGKEIDKAIITDGNPETKIRLEGESIIRRMLQSMISPVAPATTQPQAMRPTFFWYLNFLNPLKQELSPLSGSRKHRETCLTVQETIRRYSF